MTKSIIAFLLALVFFASCRKPQEFTPQNTNQQTQFKSELLTASQIWFKAIQDNFKKQKSSLARDVSLQELPWYPEWNRAKIYPISEEETLVLIPVWRYANVVYSQDFGFERRLKIVVNHAKQNMTGVIAEMIMEKSTLEKYQDDMFYYAHMQMLQGNKGKFVYYELSVDNPLYLSTSFNPDERGVECQGDDHPTKLFQVYVTLADVCMVFYTDGCIEWVQFEDCGTGAGGGGGLNPAPTNPPMTVTIPSIPPLNFPGMMPPLIPINSPISLPSFPSPTPWLPWLGYPTLGGGDPGGISGGYPVDPGSNTNPSTGYQPSQLLLSITRFDRISKKHDFGDLTEDEIKDLDATLQNMYNKSPLMAKVIDELKTHKMVWRAKTITTSTVDAYYDAGSIDGVPKHSITFNRNQYEVFKRSSTLIEELLHAFQHKFYGDNFKNIPNSNAELEAKLIRDLISNNSRIWYSFSLSNELYGRVFSAIPGQNEESTYGKYIKELTYLMGPANTNEPKLPKNMNELSVVIDGQTVNYWTIMSLFRDAWINRNPRYADAPNTSQNPELLFWLANNCNCSYRKI